MLLGHQEVWFLCFFVFANFFAYPVMYVCLCLMRINEVDGGWEYAGIGMNLTDYHLMMIALYFMKI